jgi:hypothetical protein
LQDEITSILQRREAVVQFEAGDYSFETLNELETHFGVKDKNEFKIASTEPYVSIELGPNRARLYVSANSRDASGVFFELDKVLTTRQRRFPALYTFWFTCLFGPIVANTINLINIYTNLPRSIALASSLVSLVIVTWTFWVLYIRMWWHSVIRMRRRSATVSFVHRNKEIIAAIVGAVLGVVALKLWEIYI